jgi:hypothetical protein
VEQRDALSLDQAQRFARIEGGHDHSMRGLRPARIVSTTESSPSRVSVLSAAA